MTSLPLAGYRVLEIGGYISAPYATSILQSLGAEVIKIERPGHGDDFRRALDHRSAYFRQYNAGKRSLAVDLKSTAGVELVKALVRTSHAVVENMRPGKIDRLGLGFADCRELNDEIVFASVTGFGPDGPLSERPAYDTMGQAFSAFFSIMSDEGSPRLTGTCIADLITGLNTAMGVITGLLAHERGLGAQRVETSLMESMSTLTIDALTHHFDEKSLSPTRTSRHPQAQNFVVQTSDGSSVALHLSSSQKFWTSLTLAMERPEMAADPRFSDYNSRWDNFDALREIVTETFATRPHGHWLSVLEHHDVPHAPVLTVEEYAQHPQTQRLGVFTDAEDDLRLVNAPWRFMGERLTRTDHTPQVGEDTLSIAREVLSAEAVNRLIDKGVLDAQTTLTAQTQGR